MAYQLIKNYMEQDSLRISLSKLAKETFWIDLDKWYRKGYCADQYIPYSYEKDGVIIANASVNRMDYSLDGVAKKYYQIGTVMVDPAHRGKGLAGYLVAEILKDYQEHADGIYLFANDTGKPTYEKLGFQSAKQTLYHGMIPEDTQLLEWVKVGADTPDLLCDLHERMKTQVMQGRFTMHNYGLMGFYLDEPDNLYYIETLDLYVQGKTEGHSFKIGMVFGDKQVAFEAIARSIDPKAEKVTLGFTPQRQNIQNYLMTSYEEPDCTLMCIGNLGHTVEEEGLFFEIFSHA